MKIFVTYSNTPNCIEFGNTMHEKFLKKPDVYTPILGGKTLYKGNNNFLKSMIGDNTGNNVSALNPYINEHTVIYWVGQHLNEINDDYIGFCHYRRLFDVPNNEQLKENMIFVNEMRLSISNCLYFLMCHDPTTVRTFSEFIQKIMRIFDRQTLNMFMSFMSSNILYSGNMFIMHKNQFKEYMKIMMPIYNILFSLIYPFPNTSDRSCGFILERMTSFAIFMMAEKNKNLQIKQGCYIKLGDTET